MRKWTIRFFSAFHSKPKNVVKDKYQDKKFTEQVKDALSEINKFADHVVGA